MADDPAPHDAASSALRSSPQPLEGRELLPLREIAASLYGADRVATEWACNSRMRARTRRLVDRAQALMKQQSRDLPPAR